LNLNGGVVQATAVSGTPGQLNFNGGTLRASTNNANFITIGGTYVYGGGATLDNKGYAVTIPTPLLAPTGSGVTGIASFTGGSGYIAPPIVIITNAAGDTTGFGATAIAQINPASGTVTNVIITCPGQNYTATPMFVVSGGGATSPATITGAAVTANASGGLVATGSGRLTLAGANTYTGNTVISAGTLALASGGSIGNSANINVAGSATFDVSAAPFVLSSTQTLSGNGTVNGSVTNSGTIEAGSGSTIGTLTFNNNLTLSAGGSLAVKLNKSLTPGNTNDQVYCYGTLTYGGTLVVSNLGGTLNVGDSFPLFLTGGSTGNFTAVTGSPGTGLAYSFNPTSGVLSVVTGIASNPTNITATLTGSTLGLSWPADHLGWILQAQTNSLSTGLSANWYDVVGSSTLTNLNVTIDPAQPTVFYRLRHP